VVLFAWVFGIEKGWKELHRGALMQVPSVFRFTIRYVTPVALILILTGWLYTDVIIGDKLTPRPALITAITERGKFAGEFAKKPVASADEHGAIASRPRGRDHARARLALWASLI
jgi:hypothetical protein